MPGRGLKNERFIARMALVMAATAIIAFGLFAALGMSSFGAPWWVHLHALAMMGWLALFVIQSQLIAQDHRAAHRQLGKLAAGWAIAIVPIGLFTTYWCVSAGRHPPFFAPRFFLVMDWLNILLFAALTWSALAMRRRSDWHKRLMLGGTLLLLQPAFGRLLPLPLLGHNIIVATAGVTALFLLVAALHDRHGRGAIHPAHGWTLAALAAYAVGPFAIAGLPLLDFLPIFANA